MEFHWRKGDGKMFEDEDMIEYGWLWKIMHRKFCLT
jgi:hypothetical protein